MASAPGDGAGFAVEAGGGRRGTRVFGPDDLEGDVAAQRLLARQEHDAHATFAKAAIQRRDNLQVSIRELEEKRIGAVEALEEADEALRKAQAKHDRDGNAPIADEPVEHAVDRATMIG